MHEQYTCFNTCFIFVDKAEEQYAKRGKDKSKFRMMRNLMRGKRDRDRDTRGE